MHELVRASGVVRGCYATEAMFGERICAIVASELPSGEEEDIREIAEWYSGLHQNLYAERSCPYASAAQEVFANFPAEAPPRKVMAAWHQSGRLWRELGGDTVAWRIYRETSPAVEASRLSRRSP